MTVTTLPPEIVSAMVAHEHFCSPEEACGLLAVDAGGRVRFFYALTNGDAAHDRFTIPPEEHYGAAVHAERNGWSIGGAYHSHPHSPPVPSALDRAGAVPSTWLYVITGQDEIGIFRIERGRVHTLGRGGVGRSID